MKRKDKILLIAEEEFARVGYDGLSMNDLVKKLQINKATIYYHFEDKKSLYQEVTKNAITHINQSLEDLHKKHPEATPKKRFRLFIHQIVYVVAKRPSIISLALREFANFGANTDESIVPFIEAQNGFILQGIEQLDLKEKYKNPNIYGFFSLIHGTIMNFYSIQMCQLPVGGDDAIKLDGQKSLDHIADFVADIIIDAVCKD